jgi:predicted NACHT family NTPase
MLLLQFLNYEFELDLISKEKHQNRLKTWKKHSGLEWDKRDIRRLLKYYG